MAKHTPSPWEASRNAVHKRLGPGYATCLAQVFDPDSQITTDVTEANARLMAAAPDLLAACEALLEDTLKPQHQQRPDTVIPQARAAIAKAHGEEAPNG